MSAMSDLLELKFALTALENAGTVGATTLFVSLWTTLVNDADDAGTEVSTGGTTNYGRFSITSGAPEWTAGTAAGVTTSKNTNAITYSAAGAGGYGGPVVGFGIHTAETGTGNLYFHGSLSANVQINENDTFEFAALALVITFE